MFKIVKWLAGFFITLALFIVIAAVLAPKLIDPNAYRSDIAQLVMDKTGRRLELAGELEVSVFPWLGVRTQGLRLSQPDSIGGDMLEVKQAQLRVKFLPLLSRRLEVDTIVLESPSLRLVTLADGTDSFTGLTDQASSDQDGPSEAGATAAVALVVQGVRMNNAKLIMENRQTGSVTNIEALNLDTGNLLAEPFAQINVDGILKSETDTRFVIRGLAKIDAQAVAVFARDLDVQLDEEELEMHLTIEEFLLSQQQEIEISGVTGEFNGLIDSDEPMHISLPKLAVNLLDDTASGALLSVQLGAAIAQIESLRVSDLTGLANTTAKVSLEPFDATQLFEELAIDYQAHDSSVFKRLAIRFDLSANFDKLSAQNLILGIDDSTVRGDASLANFAKPAIAFDLYIDEIDLDRYSPAEADSSSTLDDQAQSVNPLVVPMSLFKGLNANGRLRAVKVFSGGLEIDNLDVELASNATGVTVKPRANLYQGSLGGSIAYLDKGEKSQLEINNHIDLVALGKLLSDAEISEQLEGIGSLALDIVVSENKGQQSNAGSIKLLAKEGVIKGVDIKGIVDQAYAAYQELKGRDDKQPQQLAEQEGEGQLDDQTEFSELLGTFVLKDSVLTNNDFALSAPLFNLRGEGNIDLAQQSLDFLLRFSFKDSSEVQGSAAFDKLKGVILPIRLSGDLTAPSYRLDTQALLKGLLQHELKIKKAEILKEKAGIEGGENLSTKDVLRQLLINKATEKDQEETAQERPLTDVGSQGSVDQPASVERQADQASDSPAEPQKSTEDQLKDELKKKLIEGLFK